MTESLYPTHLIAKIRAIAENRAMDYQEIVVKSLKIAWGNKWLWVFGLFAGGGFSAPNPGTSFNWGEEPPAELQARLTDWLHQYWGLMIGLLVLVFLVIVFFAVLSVIANGALIRAAADIEDEREASFSLGLKAGTHYFFRLFGLSLLLVVAVGLPLMFIFGMTIWAFIAGQTALAVLFGILSLLAGLALIPLSILLSVLFLFSSRAIVLEDRRIFDAVRSAWRLTKENLGTAFLVWLISILLTIVYGAIAVVALLILAIPLIIAGIFVFIGEPTLAGVGVFAFLAFSVVAVLVIFTSGFRAFQSTYWTLAFKRLAVDSREGQGPSDTSEFEPGPSF